MRVETSARINHDQDLCKNSVFFLRHALHKRPLHVLDFVLVLLGDRRKIGKRVRG